MRVSENIKEVSDRVSQAALRSGRRPEDIKIVAITKMVDAERIKEAIEAGIGIFGENYVQEAKEKIGEIGHGVEWHMTGRLQRNKAKDAVRLFDMIQTIDGLGLAMELDRRCKALGKAIRGLIEVNVGREEGKAGIAPEELIPLLKSIEGCNNVSIRGLMAIPPYSEDAEMARPYFRLLRELRDKANREGFALSELSMGMSHDFEVAVEEGATMVRIGTAIFGERK